MRAKSQKTWHLLYKHWLCKCFKVYEDYIEFDTEQAENTKRAEKQNTIFPKESIEKADLLNQYWTKQWQYTSNA